MPQDISCEECGRDFTPPPLCPPCTQIASNKKTHAKVQGLFLFFLGITMMIYLWVYIWEALTQ